MSDLKLAPDPIPLREVTALLVKHLGLHEGQWDLAFEMQVAIGQFGIQPSEALPGAMFRISRIGLMPATQLGPLTVDAGEINPDANG